MRCYHINNFYMSGIHAGIQSAHAQHELMLKYMAPQVTLTEMQEQARGAYIEWARDHKTIIVLNGGMQGDLQKWQEFLSLSGGHKYAWASFNEDQYALNGALTNIALVLPETIYKYARGVTRALEQNIGASGFFTVDGMLLVPNDIINGWDATVDDQHVEAGPVTWTYSEFDIDLMAQLSRLNLMGA